MEISAVTMTRTFLSILSGISLILSTYGLVFANSTGGIESQISLNIAFEWQEYKEHEKDTGLNSKAKLNSLVVGVEGLKRWKYLFCGVRSVFPVFLEGGQEEVTRYDRSFQKDTLESRWIRMDGFLGYPLRSWANPYTGIRWSEVKQERKNIIIGDTLVDLRAVEEVKSWSLLLGVRGSGNFTPRLRWNYWLEYFLPLSVEVTNTALPGFKASDKDGYTLELKGGVDYFYTNSLCFGVILYGGKMHWSGSDWESFDNSLAKWPENDTFYLGGGLRVAYIF